jgi:hypothetical protein
VPGEIRLGTFNVYIHRPPRSRVFNCPYQLWSSISAYNGSRGLRFTARLRDILRSVHLHAQR